MKDLKSKILIVDDEKAIQKFLRASLKTENHEVLSAYSAAEGIREITLSHPDLILLDINLPDSSGFEVLQTLRQWSKIPVIVLSVLSNEKDKIKFLDAGADDYVTKPFTTGELLARIRGALRHRLPMGEAVFRSGRLEIDFNRRIVSVAGNPLKCTRIEYNLLKLLVTHAGKVVTQSQIMREVWEPGMENETNILRVYICNLRKKIEENPEKPELIITEPAVGYRLVVQG
ncbi:MAG: response regulator transcription factor [Turneriella sp.]|nr:response regulator transcription factor [Turneriella sp.]